MDIIRKPIGNRVIARKAPTASLSDPVRLHENTVHRSGHMPKKAPAVAQHTHSLHIPKKKRTRLLGKRRRHTVGILICVGIVLLIYILVAWKSVGQALTAGNTGYALVLEAAELFRARQFDEARERFIVADTEFTIANRSLRVLPGFVVDTLRFVPGLSKPASGRSVIIAGSHIARAGIPLSDLAIAMTKDTETEVSLLSKLEQAKDPLYQAGQELDQAQDLLLRVNVFDIPEARRERFVQARELLPMAISALTTLREREQIFIELLGGNGPRKYLFLFQNNHELRATGGFIGSYAVLNVHDGIIEKPTVDGIFNPDGQLKENIVPPKPIQKISAGWSLHDSNWYPDFPTSAEKAIFFYEKTGGPTVDGVVTVTPTVMERLLEVLGPIDMPEYGVTISAENFIPIVQEQVEEKYDKTENNPKKILSDLSTEIFSRVASLDSHHSIERVIDTFMRGLDEKHVLVYVRHPEIRAIIDASGWSGKLLETDKDYVSVVHSNINGYKTDGVMQETLAHRSEIMSDGSVVDTLSITRHHGGGNTPYEWWNKVNADYLRVYVPLGSRLISVKGTTWEFPPEPLDYNALGFRRDRQVEEEEGNTRIHEVSGTRISEENGKTVFGAWVYVSPGESGTVELTYTLPFKLDTNRIRQGEAERFSILYQKQSGTVGSAFSSEIRFPDTWNSVWQTGGDLVPYERSIVSHGTLAVDHFVGTAFTRMER